MDKLQTKFNNYKSALSRLHESISKAPIYNDLTFRDGVIHRFKITTELAWKTIREYLLIQEVSDINTPKNVMRAAFSADIITDDRGWLQMLNDRNSTSHIYDEEDADAVYERIISKHILLLDELSDTLIRKAGLA